MMGRVRKKKKRIDKTKFDTKLMIQAVHIADIGKKHGIQNMVFPKKFRMDF